MWSFSSAGTTRSLHPCEERGSALREIDGALGSDVGPHPEDEGARFRSERLHRHCEHRLLELAPDERPERDEERRGAHLRRLVADGERPEPLRREPGGSLLQGRGEPLPDEGARFGRDRGQELDQRRVLREVGSEDLHRVLPHEHVVSASGFASRWASTLSSDSGDRVSSRLSASHWSQTSSRGCMAER